MSRVGEAAGPEWRMLRRARVVLALQIAAALTIAIAMLGGCVYRLEADELRSEVDQRLAYQIAQADPQVNTPCQWLFISEKGRLDGPSQPPTGFPLLPQLRAAPANGVPVIAQQSTNGTTYTVMTKREGARVFQAVFDTRYQRADLQQLLRALITTGLVGLICVALVSTGLARRSLWPLGQALARQRRFVADASHELRTPLTRLHTRAQLLLRWRGDELPPKLAGELEHLVRGTRELGDVVEDLLLSASLHPTPDRRGRVDLVALVRGVLEAEQPRMDQREVVLDADNDASGVVYGAESPLRRMVSALVDNAIGHTKPTGRIVLGLRRRDDARTIELDVSDDGTGFDPKDSARIFERFARVGEHDAHRFGLGLALVREVVESHGGTISAHGTPGAGARFVVRLPAAAPPADAAGGR